MTRATRFRSTVKKCTLAIGLAAAPLGAQSPGRPAQPFPDDLDRYLSDVVARWQIPGMAIAIVRNDSTLITKGYGVRALGQPDRVDANTVFDIASLTKSFTAAAAAILVDRGVISWDDPVKRYLPDLELPADALTRQATIRDFLSHRTGLEAANMMWVPTAVSRAEVLRRMRYLRSVAPFREQMVYSNVGYTVAGEAAAAAAGVPYEQLLRDFLIKPLGLTSTTWTYEQAATMPNVAASHATIDKRLQVVPRERQRHAIAPAAAVQSTANDLARWLRLHLNNGVLDGKRFVSDSAMRHMHSVQSRIPTTPAMRAARMVQDTVTGYGMGWQIMDYRGHRVFWHTGNGDGQIAYMAIYPAEKLGFVIMVNTWSAPLVHLALANYIADTYLGFPRRDWAAEEFARRPAADSAREARERTMIAMRSSSPPPVPLTSYAGEYQHPLFGPVWIRHTPVGLTLQMGEGRVADLEYHGDNTFYTVWRDPLFRSVYGSHVNFTVESDSVVSFSIQLNRDQFTAVKRAAWRKPGGGGGTSSGA
jgi:CubicO group peptidase (beta-lactamase class C family)